ncbi:MAG: queuosine precursor transporter [Thermodesulfobacteriota bacterium]
MAAWPNELIWVSFLVLDLLAAVLVFRLFGRHGLYGLIVMNIIICNIQVMKIVKLFGLTTTLGNILYASIFFATDILGEMYGKNEARRGVWIGFVMLVLATVYMQVALLFTPDRNDLMHPVLARLFAMYPRVAAASLLAYLVSQLHDVWAFEFWKLRTRGRHLWLRNNASTMVSQALDTVVFCSVAFWGLFPWSDFLQILLTTYLLKFLVAVADTPFIYLAKALKAPDLET